MDIAALRTQYELVLQDQADFGETLDAVSAALEDAPDNPGLYRLRARLYVLGYFHTQAWRDWCAVLRLLPEDREAALEAARLQMRWAAHIASSEQEDEKAQGSGSADGEEAIESAREGQDFPNYSHRYDEDEYDTDYSAQYPRIAELEQEAAQQFVHLMQKHVADYDFALTLINTWEDLPIWWPWTNYTLLLLARARWPQDAQLKRREALFLAALARDESEESDTIPAGYLSDAMGTLWHAQTVFQALQALSGVEQDEEILQERAELLIALQDYPAARAIFLQLAEYCSRRQQQARDQEKQTYWQEVYAEAMQEAENCAAGRAHFLQGRFDEMQDGIAKFEHHIAEQHVAPALQARIHDSLQHKMEEMQLQLQQTRAELNTLQDAPDGEALQAIQNRVQRLAPKIASLVNLSPMQLRALQEEDFEQNLSPWFEAQAPGLLAEGLELRTHFENLYNNRVMQEQAQGQFWSDAKGEVVVVLEAVRQFHLVRIISRFADRNFLVTANSRGISGFEHGPECNTMSVHSSTPLLQILALHRARLATQRIQEPDNQVLPVPDLEALEQLDNDMRRALNRFRLEQGVTEVEIRGFHADYHQQFAQALREEVERLLRELKESGAELDN